MTKYKSGITGKAAVWFGGKIAIGIGKCEDMPCVVLCEADKEHTIGEDLPLNTPRNEMVFLHFPQLESLKSFRKALDLVENYFYDKEL